MGRKKKLTHEEILDLAGKGMDLKDLIDAGISDDEHIYRPEDSISTSMRMSTSKLDSKLVGCGDLSVSAGGGVVSVSSGIVSEPAWVDSMWGTSIGTSISPYLSDERNLIFGPGSEKYNIKLDYNGTPVEMTGGQMHDMLKLVSEWIGSYAPIRLSVETDKYPETLKWIMTDLIRNTAEKCIAIIRKRASKEDGRISPGCVDRLAKAITNELINPASDKCSDLEHIILKR